MQSNSRMMTGFYHWAIPLCLAASALLVMLLGEDGEGLLRYQRSEILNGEGWRLLSGHLVHLGWSHLSMNLLALALVWALLGDTLTLAGWLLLLLCCALFDGLGLLLLNPGVEWYVGLSGVLHGLFLAGSLAGLASGRRDALLLLIALVAKLAWEQLAGPLPGSEAAAGGPVVVDAHLYGAIAGGATAALMLGLPGWRRRFLRGSRFKV
jgi:rhomboid family GlyGly-CTERM serine protease